MDEKGVCEEGKLKMFVLDERGVCKGGESMIFVFEKCVRVGNLGY